MEVRIPVKHIKNGRKYHSIRHYERVMAKQRNNNNIIKQLKSLYAPVQRDYDMWQAVIYLLIILGAFLLASTIDFYSQAQIRSF